MTKEEAIQKLIDLAKSELGYHETGENHTKYAVDSKVIAAAGWNSDGYAWCVTYLVWLFVTAFGLEKGCKMLRSVLGSVPLGVQNLAANFQAVGATTAEPTIGCPVCYRGMGHIGLCTDISPLTCLDGNYSDSVKYHWSPSTDAVLYLIPDWSVVVNDSSDDSSEEKDEPEDEGSSTETTFSAGDVVKLKSGATYYNGGSIPARYFLKRWYILQVNGDRAVLNESTDGLIVGWMSPVNTSNLTLVASESELQTTSTTASTTSTTVPNNSIYQQIVEKIQSNSVETSPVILNNTATSTHSYGGKIKNVEDR